MSNALTKTELLETLHSDRKQWEALLAAIGEEHMAQPGIAGYWSTKDVIAHITAYEQWLVDWLKAAQRHEFPPPSVLDDEDIERRNARVYDETHSRKLEDVLAQATQTFQELVAVIEAFSEADFTDPERTAWFMKPYWGETTALGAAVANLSYEHYQEHIPDLAAWLEKLKAA
jgi:hypothetical protein